MKPSKIGATLKRKNLLPHISMSELPALDVYPFSSRWSKLKVNDTTGRLFEISDKEGTFCDALFAFLH